MNLTQTDKKGKAHKGELMDSVRAHAEEYAFLWVFDVEHMRNNILQEVRTAWKGSRMFLGRNAVMRKALGTTKEDECRINVHKIANLLEGDVGLLFTNEEPHVVTEWFESFKRADFARSGNKTEHTFELPAGPINLTPDDPAPHSMEPQFRKLGMTTSLIRGVPTLGAPHVVCTKGDVLNANQVQLLKLFHKTYATFQIIPKLCVKLADGEITEGIAKKA